MFVKGLLVKKLFDENLEFAIDGDNVVARKHNTTILIPGNVYRAELDGEVYETSARKITNDDASLVFDNFEIRDYYASDNIEVTIYNSSNTAARSVKIYSVNHNANKINPDLLPDNIGGGGGASSWNELKDAPFGEKPPLFDIRWDGKTEGHEVVTEFNQVKVDDFVLSNPNELIGAKVTFVDYHDGHEEVEEVTADVMEDYGGAIGLYGGAVTFIYDVDAFASESGIPSGVLSNGVWFGISESFYISALTAPTKVKKIDSKYLPTIKIFRDWNGNYTSNMTYDEILEAISADPFLSGMFINENYMDTTDFIKILSAYWLPDQWNDYQLILWFGKDGDKVLINPQNEILGGHGGEE